MQGRNNMANDSFADDALLIDNDTTTEDIKEFLKRRVEDPQQVGDAVVWNFNSHKIDREALKRDLRGKLRGDRYLIPYQVTGTWGFMFDLLPQDVKEAEILVYHPHDEEYYAYRNFYSDIPQEVRTEFRHQLSRLADTRDRGIATSDL